MLTKITSRNFHVSVNNLRYMPRPGTLTQRLFREVTKPIIEPIEINRSRIYLERQEEQRKREEENAYKLFLVRDLKENFFGRIENNSVIAMIKLEHDNREFMPKKNMLYEEGFKLHLYSNTIQREAAKGTRWETFTNAFANDNFPLTYLVGDNDPIRISKAMKILNTAPYFIVIGAYVPNRILNIDELASYCKLGNLDNARGQLLSTLQHKQKEILFILTQEQKRLFRILSLRSNQDGK